MVEECEVSCVYFRALERTDMPLALLNRRAREAAQEGAELPGSAGSLCGACVARKKKNTALGDKETVLMRLELS